MKQKENNTTISSCSLCFQMSLTVIIFGSAGTIIALLYAWGKIGWFGSSSFAVGTCGNTYFSTKYGEMVLINQIVTVGSCVAAIMAIIMLFIMISFVCKRCKGQLNPTGCARGCVFFTWSLIIMGIIPVVGYYISFFIQFGQCTNNTLDTTQTLVIIGLSGCVLLLSLLACLISSCQSCGIKDDREDIYKEVRREMTEAYEEQHKKKPYSRSPLRRQQEVTKQKMNPYQQTVYQSPYKKIKDIRQDQQHYPVEYPPPKYNHSPRQYPKKMVHHNEEENVITNLHPNLRGIDPQEYVQRQKNVRKYQSQDRQFFKKQQNKYLEQYDRRGILSRGDYHQPERQRQYAPKFQRSPLRSKQQRNYRQDRDQYRNQDDGNYDYQDREYDRRPERQNDRRPYRQFQRRPDRQYDRRPDMQRSPERRDYNQRVDSDYLYPSLDYRNHSPPIREGMMRNYIRNR